MSKKVPSDLCVSSRILRRQRNHRNAFARWIASTKSIALKVLLGFSPTEIVTLIYLAIVNGIVFAFRSHLTVWRRHFLAHIAIAALILGISKWRRANQSRFVHFLGLWYPLLLFIFFFEEIQHLVHIVFPGWFDSILIGLDYRLLRTDPSVWLQQHVHVWLTEYMNFAYVSYFFLTPLVGGILYYRREWSQFHVLMLSTAIAYYLCYLMFLIFPTEGPYHALSHLYRIELEGKMFTALINWVESWGRVHGGAFPSAHVAGSFVVLLCAYKFVRRLFWVLLPIVLSLFVSTVYGRYHYVSDVIGGLIAGFVGERIASGFNSSSK